LNSDNEFPYKGNDQAFHNGLDMIFDLGSHSAVFCARFIVMLMFSFRYFSYEGNVA
jgi:hypothetical protein